jgi:hypothetical protein
MYANIKELKEIDLYDGLEHSVAGACSNPFLQSVEAMAPDLS